MALPHLDVNYLNERGLTHQVATESGMTCVVMPQWPLPSGFDRNVSDLLIRLSPGYPDVPPDMWWFSPHVNLKNGQVHYPPPTSWNRISAAVGNAGRDT